MNPEVEIDKIIILQRNFSFNDWENNTVHLFREHFKSFIAIENLAKVLMLSTDLTAKGISFYVMTSDIGLANEILEKFNMEKIKEIEGIEQMGLEYGNRELLKLFNRI